jgi:hypothetical protein
MSEMHSVERCVLFQQRASAGKLGTAAVNVADRSNRIRDRVTAFVQNVQAIQAWF